MIKKVLAILPISIGGRLTTQSIIDGFCQNGCEVSIYDELKSNEGQSLINRDYDCIVGYDYSAIMLKKAHNLNIVALNYFSDEIRKNMSGSYWREYVDELSNDDNYTFYWDKALVEQEKSVIKNVFYLPHFVNFDVYKDFGAEPKFDVMFAGRLDTDFRLQFFENLMTRLPDLKFCWYAFEKHFEDALRRAKNPDSLKKCYKGFIDNEYDMAKALNNAKIVFNMNSQGKSSLNYRTFQTVACKRLLISDYREELSLFEAHIPSYKDVDDLSGKIKQYLKDKKLYDYVCDKCYAIAKENHNSKDGVAYMMNVLTNIHAVKK